MSKINNQSKDINAIAEDKKFQMKPLPFIVVEKWFYGTE